MKEVKIKILFGEHEVSQFEETAKLTNLKDNIFNYSFNTESEKRAFLLGLNECLGWGDFIVINQK